MRALLRFGQWFSLIVLAWVTCRSVWVVWYASERLLAVVLGLFLLSFLIGDVDKYLAERALGGAV